MKPKADSSAFIFHIRDAIAKIEEYLERASYKDFLKSEWDQDATIRNLELIGEAISHINPEFRKSRPSIPWRKIIALRNILIHAYFGVDLKLVWKIINRDLPELKKEIDKIIEEF